MDLLGRVPSGHHLCLNSTAAVSMVLAVDGLAETLRDAVTAPSATPADG